MKKSHQFGAVRCCIATPAYVCSFKLKNPLVQHEEAKMKLGIITTASIVGVTLALSSMFLSKVLSAGPPDCPLATGKFDKQAGASNQITTCEVLDAVSLIKAGHIVRLGRNYESGMPIFPGRVFEFEQKMPAVIPAGEEGDPRPTGGPFPPNSIIFNDGLVFSEIDQVGTQFDGLGHIGRANGSDPRDGKYYLGLKVKHVNATPDEPEGGLLQLGVESVKPIMTRGILIDLAPFGTSRCARKKCWDAGQEIKLADVFAALEAQGMSPDVITPGDAVLFNTGWSNLWMVDNDRFNSGEPGIGLEVGQWLVEKKVVLVGSDTWSTEVVPSAEGTFPLHQLFMTDNGIFNHENLYFAELISAGVYEFAYVFMPVPIKGATGSPGSPLAIY